MKNKILILAFLVFTTITVTAQNTVSVSLLQGDWYAQENNIDYNLKFLTVDTVSYNENGTENTHTFTITDDVLTFNSRSFSILGLSHTKLDLQEVGTTNGVLNFIKSQHPQHPPTPPDLN